jgi:hypothetical protein
MVHLRRVCLAGVIGRLGQVIRPQQGRLCHIMHHTVGAEVQHLLDLGEALV